MNLWLDEEDYGRGEERTEGRGGGEERRQRSKVGDVVQLPLAKELGTTVCG